MKSLPPEIANLVAAYRACNPEDADDMLYVLMRERGSTPIVPALLAVKDEADSWAQWASIPELEAYAAAAIAQLDQRPSGRRLRVQRAIRALRALEPDDMESFAGGLGPFAKASGKGDCPRRR